MFCNAANTFNFCAGVVDSGMDKFVHTVSIVFWPSTMFLVTLLSCINSASEITCIVSSGALNSNHSLMSCMKSLVAVQMSLRKCSVWMRRKIWSCRLTSTCSMNTRILMRKSLATDTTIFACWWSIFLVLCSSITVLVYVIEEQAANFSSALLWVVIFHSVPKCPNYPHLQPWWIFVV